MVGDCLQVAVPIMHMQRLRLVELEFSKSIDFYNYDTVQCVCGWDAEQC